jgi:hypothetical protein
MATHLHLLPTLTSGATPILTYMPSLHCTFTFTFSSPHKHRIRILSEQTEQREALARSWGQSATAINNNNNNNKIINTIEHIKQTEMSK